MPISPTSVRAASFARGGNRNHRTTPARSNTLVRIHEAETTKTKKGEDLFYLKRGCLVASAHVESKVAHAVGKAVLVVVPGNDLGGVVVKNDRSVNINGRRLRGSEVVGRDELLHRDAEDALEATFRNGGVGGSGKGGHELLLGLEGLGGGNSEVHERDVGDGNADRDTLELALKLGKDLDHSLGGTSGGGDDVAHGGAAGTNVLGRETVKNLLRRSGGVDGGHHAVLDTESLVEDRGNGGEAVGLRGN